MGNRETGNLMDERRPIESMWSERMKAAEEQCHLARAEADAALELCCCGDTSAQIEALRQTFARETAALDEYMEVLQAFHEFVVAGERPS